MITWMQKHKKWLVVTIWISTIAFVGAGFVGWGSYEYGKQGGVVAVVGDREISVEEYQQEYSNLYDQYSKMLGTSFNNEMAEQLNLRDVAYNQVLQKNLILSYANSLGLDVTNEDVAKELIKYQVFLKNGKFDKPTYLQILAQNRTTPVIFEDSLKRGILLQKIQNLFLASPNAVEIENLNKLLFIEDDINIKILKASDIIVSSSEDEIKAYWENNKSAYISEVQYEVKISKLPVVTSNASDEDIKSHYAKFKTDYKKEDGKIKSLEEAKADVLKDLDRRYSKKEALKKYIQVKKGEDNLEESASFTQNSLPFDSENNMKIVSAEVGTLIKPFLYNDTYVITQLIKKIDSKPLSFEAAKSRVSIAYDEIAKNKKLNDLAKKELSTFKGTNIKKVTRESVDKITALNPKEAAKFLNELFSVTNKEGLVNLDNKIVLFRVNASELGEYSESRNEMVKSTLIQLQDQELMTNLVKRLENTYEVQSSIDVKE